MSDFDRWWQEEGSGILPNKDDDMESHAKRVAKIAWSNGEYKANQFAINKVREAFFSVITKPEGVNHTAPCLVFPDEFETALMKALGGE